jgi:hypothetical protein
MDALLAAPASHRVLVDNDRVRVLEVVIEPGTREPEHTHRTPSVMIIDEPARVPPEGHKTGDYKDRTTKGDGDRLRRMGRTLTVAVGVARSGVCGSVWAGSAW